MSDEGGVIFEGREPVTKPSVGKKASNAAGGLIAIVAAVGFVGWIYLDEVKKGDETSLIGSNSAEYQSDNRGSNIALLPTIEEETVPTINIDNSALESEQEMLRRQLAEQNAQLQEQIAKLTTDLANVANADTDNGAAERIQQLSDLLKSQTDLAATRLSDLEDRFASEIKRIKDEATLNAENERLRLAENERQQRVQAQNAALRAEEEQRQRLELQRQREEAAEINARQITSKAVVFDNGRAQASSEAQGSGSVENVSTNPQDRDSVARSFVAARQAPSSVTQSEIIAFPSQTIVQGTMIQATLENAISSALPGQINGVVTYDVYSYDGQKVLIPRGSRLIGEYSSNIELGQKRILAVWTRIITPEGVSVAMRAFGGDQLGVSGLTGVVDNKFRERFGSAALISLIGAVPDAVAMGVENTLASELISAAGSDVNSAASTAVEGYLNIPAEIHVAQGQIVTVMVDRDMEIYP